MADQFKACAVDGCKGNAHWYYGARGFCGKHYARWKKHGSPFIIMKHKQHRPALDWLEKHASYQGDDCLTWPFAKTPTGYGAIIFRGKRRNPSRAMCMLAHGEPPTPRHEAAHNCGKGSQGCVNPRHLAWKTHAENEADKLVHGATRGGEATPASKLTWAIVREIRAMAGTMPMAKIGERFGVNRSTVGYIIRGDTWKE